MKRLTSDPAELRSLPPFSWFDDEAALAALAAAEQRHYAARVTIRHAGSPADGLYILLSGRVHVAYEHADGREFIIATVRPHEFFGELELFDGRKAIETFRARDESRALFIPREVVLNGLQTNVRAAMCMLQKVTRRLALCEQKLADVATMSVQHRIATAMLDNASAAEVKPVVEVGSEELARLAGCSREMVSRVVRRLIDERVLRRHRRGLIILDREKLAVCGRTHGNRRTDAQF